MTCVFTATFDKPDRKGVRKVRLSRNKARCNLIRTKTENRALSSVTAQILALMLIKPLRSIGILPGAREGGILFDQGIKKDPKRIYSYCRSQSGIQLKLLELLITLRGRMLLPG